MSSSRANAAPCSPGPHASTMMTWDVCCRSGIASRTARRDPRVSFQPISTRSPRRVPSGTASAGRPSFRTASPAAAVAAAGLLAIREELHGLVAKISWPELRSGLLLLAMTFIALPIMPGDPIGPFGGVNPREVWIIAIVLARASFNGYVAVNYLGASRGVLLAAAAGGLVSSTAVTARRAAVHEGPLELLAAGVSVATAVSFLRVFAIAAALQPRLLLEVLLGIESEAGRPTFCLVIIECIDIAELERSNDLLGDRLATI